MSRYNLELMKIERILLREIRMRLKSPFETSFGTVQDRRIVLVEVVVLGPGAQQVLAGVRIVGNGQDRRQIEPVGFRLIRIFDFLPFQHGLVFVADQQTVPPQ